MRCPVGPSALVPLSSLVASLGLVISLVGLGCGGDERPPGIGGGGGGGGGGGSGSGADASTPDAMPILLAGELCQIVDLRIPTDCVAADLTGLDVTLRGDSTQITPADGSFEFDSPQSGTAILDLAQVAISHQPSLIEVALDEVGNVDVLAPIVTAAAWEGLKTSIGANEPDGTATLAVYVRTGATAVAGAEVNAVVTPTFYDGIDENDWNTNGQTGARGAALIFNVPADVATADFEVIGPGGAPTLNVVGVPVREGTITFVSVTL